MSKDDRASSSSPTRYRYRFEEVEFDEALSLVRVAGATVVVEPKPLQVLSELLRHPNEVVTRGHLFEVVWKGRETVDNVLGNAVNKLRNALGEQAGKRIVTVPRVGYRFEGPLERISVGQHDAQSNALKAGMPVPGRSNFVLRRELSVATGGRRIHVWLAEHKRLGEQRVFKFADDGERLGLLKREYTIYRVLREGLGDRDDFARVIDANFAEAPYFLECAYGGIDLAHWATEDDRLAALSGPQRIALFLQIARAVAAAHGVGVLHKDLKPANVLIHRNEDGAPAIRLTDFGNSRLLEPGKLAALGVTAMGLTVTQVVRHDSQTGTLLYLAPELLAGRPPTTRSDLYALGLMLYQMLVGDLRRPMSTGWERDIDDPLLREDLTAATEGQPEARLGSVAGLVERLETLDQRRSEAARLANEHAAAADAIARLQRSRARRPWAIAAFASLAIGLAASLWFFAQTRAALRTAQQQTDRAESITDFLVKDILQSPDIVQSGDMKPLTVFDVMQRASANAATRFAGQPRSEAAVRYQLGRIYMRMGNTSEADRELVRASDQLRPLVPANDPLLLSIRFTQVRLWTREMDYAAEAAALFKEASGDAGPSILDGTSEVALLARIARFEQLSFSEHPEEAAPVGRRMIELADRVGDLADRVESRRLLLMVYRRMKRDDDAAALAKELAGPPFNDTTADGIAIAVAHTIPVYESILAGQDVEAENRLIESRDRLIRTLGPNQAQVASVHSELGRVYDARGDYVRSAASLRAARDAYEASLGADHQFTNVTTCNLAIAELLAGRPRVALELFDSVRPWFKLHATHGYYPNLEIFRSRALSELKRYSEAWDGLKVIDPNVKGIGEVTGGLRANYDAERGVALVGMGRVDEGLRLLESALAFKRTQERKPFEIRDDDAHIGKLIAAYEHRTSAEMKH